MIILKYKMFFNNQSLHLNWKGAILDKKKNSDIKTFNSRDVDKF